MNASTKKKSSKNSKNSNQKNGNAENWWNPVVSSLPALSERNKIQEKFSNKEISSLNGKDLEALLVANLCDGLINGNSELFEKSIEMAKTASESHPNTKAILLWLSLFEPQLEQGLSELAESCLAQFKADPQIQKWAILAFSLSENWERASLLLDEAKDSPDFLAIAGELKQKIESRAPMLQGSGMLIASLNFGSFHNPAAPQERHRFNYRVLEKCLSLQPENFELLFEVAMYAFFLGDFENCISQLDKMLSMMPQYDDALALKGFAQEKSGDLQIAEKTYQEVLKSNPNHPLANTNLGKLWMARGNSFKAELLLKRAIAAAPEYPEALSAYARLLDSEKSNEAQVLDAHKKALSLEPESSDYHLQYCISLLKLGLVDKLHGEWHLHKKYIQAFTQKESIRRLINIVLTGAKEPLQFVAIAELLNENGFYLTAGIFAQRAWKKRYTVSQDKQREFYYHLGMQSARCDEHRISLEAYQALSEIESNKGPANIYIAMALSRLGKFEEAKETLEKSGEEKNRLAVLNGTILYGLNRVKEAMESQLDAIMVEKPNFLSLYNGIKYSFELEDWESSEKFIGCGESNWPEAPQFWALKSELELRRGNVAKAEQLLKDKIYKDGKPSFFKIPEGGSALENDVEEPIYMLGWSFIQQQNWDALKELLEFAEEKIPWSGLWEILQAEANRAEGNLEKAKLCLSETNKHPLAEVARYLIAQGTDDSQMEEAAKAAMKNIKDRGKILYHPEGFKKITASV